MRYLILLALLACSSSRPLDAEPSHTVLDTPRPAGELFVSLSPTTGGDQGRRVQSGVLLVVEVDAHRYTQTIASCDSAGTGSIDPPEPGVLASADCDSRVLSARRQDGAVVVTDDRGVQLASIALP